MEELRVKLYLNKFRSSDNHSRETLEKMVANYSDAELDYLVDSGYLTESIIKNDKQLYRITTKGKDFRN